jgi:hypothetical protein
MTNTLDFMMDTSGKLLTLLPIIWRKGLIIESWQLFNNDKRAHSMVDIRPERIGEGEESHLVEIVDWESTISRMRRGRGRFIM